MSSNDRKLIAVTGATGQQGGGVVRALQAGGQFKVRALTRHPDKHRANKIAGRQPTSFSVWARVNFPTSQPTTKELS